MFAVIGACFLFSGLFAPPPVRAQTTAWPNEPAGSTLVNEWNWDSCPGGGWQPANGCGSIVSDPTAPLSPNNVLSFKYNPSTGYGGGDPYIIVNNLPEWYIGVWAWIDPNFISTGSLLNKLFVMMLADGSAIWTHVSGSYCSDLCYGGPFYVDMGISTRQPNPTMLSNCHLEGTVGYGDCPAGSWLLPPYMNLKEFTKGSWHLLEYYVKKSTTDTSRDGIIRWWIDGVMQGNVTNANLGGPLIQVSFTPAWTPPTQSHWTHPSEHRYDHVRISSPNCPPDGCAVTGNTGGGGTSIEQGVVCDPIPDVEIYVPKDQAAPVGQAIRDALGRN